MQKDPVSRRAMLRRAGLLLGGAGALGCMRGNSLAANAGTLLTDGKTPPLSVEAMTALDDALGGKNGSYIENEGVYSTAAVHQHMLEEQPRIIFLHYYGRGQALTLVEGFRVALDQLGGKGKQAGS
jgi:Domain of Unknown Function (DUF1259)